MSGIAPIELLAEARVKTGLGRPKESVQEEMFTSWRHVGMRRR